MAGSLKILMLVAAAGLAPAGLVVAGPAPFGGGARAAEAEAWNFQCMEDEDSGVKICTTEIVASDDGLQGHRIFSQCSAGRCLPVHPVQAAHRPLCLEKIFGG